MRRHRGAAPQWWNKLLLVLGVLLLALAIVAPWSLAVRNTIAVGAVACALGAHIGWRVPR